MTKAFEILKDITLNGKSFRNQVLARCVINVIQNSKWVTLFNYLQPKEESTSFGSFGKNVHQFEYPLTTNDELAIVNSIVRLYTEIKNFDVKQVSLRKIETT